MWLGDDNTMQGVGDDGHLYQWVQGVDGLGNAVGCWRRVKSQPRQAPYTRHCSPFLGDVAQGPDGQLYQWVQGVDGLGNAFGFWRVARGLRSLARRALPIARRLAPFVPGGAAALTAATPFLRQVGVEGADGLGALYEAPDGSMYQVQGIGADELDGLADADELNGLSEDELQGLAADDELNGLGAEDELNGFGADEELNGIGADEELNGIGAEDELSGLGAEDELNGIGAEDLEGIAADGVGADEDLNGLAEEELQGLGDDDSSMNGFVRDAGVNGVDGYRPDRPRETPLFSPSPNAPMWAPLW